MLSWMFTIMGEFSSFDLWFVGGIFPTPRGWMQRRCCCLREISMVLSSSETAKAKKESFPSQVIKNLTPIVSYVPLKLLDNCLW